MEDSSRGGLPELILEVEEKELARLRLEPVLEMEEKELARLRLRLHFRFRLSAERAVIFILRLLVRVFLN